ncbi:phosphoglycolate phosphatase [Rhodanobacter sp. DHG33]|uniref:phosphoglycolate phosphatase n=1 Tax=Rhodanobacter sp. DHG33 TaxID=2775921 RepID=UPI0017833111|nr:phosphoglycolate phosphatase [Rhodanobacter sp. DHG33]MBD8899131.1 phosphoglycolate phosphatase [Rhodanobacter sp. DHG33]
MKPLPTNVEGVLFDLDGTLLDSAPDLHAALVAYCAEVGAPAPDYAPVRNVVSRGSRAILRCAFDENDAALLARMPRYLELYQGMLATHTRPFDGIAPLLEGIESRGQRWGIVTNKPGFLTEELIARMDWDLRASAVVCGDTLPVKKPDPAPVQLACERAGVAPAHSVFVGDDARDVEAGRAAGLYTVAVRWGYLDGGDPDSWGADAVIDHPQQLADLLGLQVAA